MIKNRQDRYTHLAKHLADLRTRDEVPPGAKDSIFRVGVIAVRGMGEAEGHV
jgi:hypothetical protein